MTIHWDAKFSTGFTRLDDQHKTLFEFTNNLEKQIKEDISQEAVKKIINFLENYAQSHFIQEEKCMVDKKCSALDRNCAEHHKFLKFVKNIKEKYSQNNITREVLILIHTTIEKWMVNHIMRIDTQLKPLSELSSPEEDLIPIENEHQGYCYVLVSDQDSFDEMSESFISPAIVDCNLLPFQSIVEVDANPSSGLFSEFSRCRICIADISTIDHQLWFKVGFALSLHKDIIFVCRKDTDPSRFPVDLSRHPVIFYENTSEDMQKLRQLVSGRIKQVLDRQKEIGFY